MAKPKRYIYYVQVLDPVIADKVIDERLSFHPNVHHSLKSMHGEDNISTRRMELASGKWEPFPCES